MSIHEKQKKVEFGIDVTSSKHIRCWVCFFWSLAGAVAEPQYVGV